MKFLKKLLAALIFVPALLLSTQTVAALVEGKDYKLVNPTQSTNSGNKIEVLEFFFYGCSHCYHLHPELTNWEKKIPKDVDLVLVPTVFNPQWEPMAYTYYALEVLGQQHKLLAVALVSVSLELGPGHLKRPLPNGSGSDTNPTDQPSIVLQGQRPHSARQSAL